MTFLASLGHGVTIHQGTHGFDAGLVSKGRLVGQDRLHHCSLAQSWRPRRHASAILTEYGNPDIMRFLSPIADGKDNRVVEQTLFDDVHFDDADLGLIYR